MSIPQNNPVSIPVHCDSAPGRKRTLLDCALIMLLSVFVSSSPGITQTFTPNKDATIFGVTTTGANGSGTLLIAGNNLLPETRRALVSFNLSAIPTNAVVSAVSLQMVCTNVPSGSVNRAITLQKITSVWTEGPSTGGGVGDGQATSPASANDVTWAQRIVPGSNWTTPGGDFTATISASQAVNGTGTYTWTTTAQLVADVQSWVTSPAANSGWILRGVETGNGTVKGFASRESSTVANRPTLTVTYTAPSTVPGWSLY